MSKFKRVSLSGGGVKGLAQLGVLHYFFEQGKYDPEIVEVYSGTSVGSSIALLLICGYAPMEIFTYVYKTVKLIDSSQTESIWNVFEKTGLFPVEIFTDKVQELVKDKMGFIPTLFDLKKITKKTLITTTVNITREKPIQFSPDSHPKLSCIDAVKMSCNLPCIFQKIVREGDIYVDGGLADGFPISHIDDGISPILGIVVLGIESPLNDATTLGYLYRLINMPINTITKLQCQNLSSNVTLVKVECKNIPIFQFSMRSKEKMNLFLQGFREAEFVDNLQPLKVKFEDWDFDWNPFGQDSKGLIKSSEST